MADVPAVVLPTDGAGKPVRTVEPPGFTHNNVQVEQEVDTLGYADGSLADADLQKLRNLDLTLSGLRDALRGGTPKTLADIVTALALVAVTGPLTDTQLRASAVPVQGTFWPATQPVSETHLPNLDVALSSRLKPNDQVRDTYGRGEVLADQAGAGAVLTFTFAGAVDLLWVEVFSPAGDKTGPVARVDPFGGTPASGVGVPVFDTIPKPIVVHIAAGGSVKVFAIAGTTASVWGQGYV